MIFGSKQLEEKNKMIQLLEDEKDRLQRELKTVEAANDSLKKREIDLDAQIVELLQKVKDISSDLERQKESTRALEQGLSENQNEAVELRNHISSMELALKNEVTENEKLKRDLDVYRKMSPDEYLKLGTELFTLEKLTYILGKAQSEAFISVQKRQKRNSLQKLMNDIQILLCPIRTDKDLLKLLLTVDPDTEPEIKDIKNSLGKVSLQQVVSSGAVDKRQCVLQKRIELPRVAENIYVFDAENADEYMRKIALSRLTSVFYQIANWEGY